MSELDRASTGPVPAPAANGQPSQGQPSLSDAARAPLDREMREAKDGVLRMGSIVEIQIRKAIDALTAHDEAAATDVIVGDRRINEVQVEVSSIITLAIATQGPVARDLRFLLTLDHVTYELERMGDHASSVAKQARKLAPHPPLKGYVDLPRLGSLVADQVRGILHALVDIDVERRPARGCRRRRDR